MAGLEERDEEGRLPVADILQGARRKSAAEASQRPREGNAGNHRGLRRGPNENEGLSVGLLERLGRSRGKNRDGSQGLVFPG